MLCCMLTAKLFSVGSGFKLVASFVSLYVCGCFILDILWIVPVYWDNYSRSVEKLILNKEVSAPLTVQPLAALRCFELTVQWTRWHAEAAEKSAESVGRKQHVMAARLLILGLSGKSGAGKNANRPLIQWLMPFILIKTIIRRHLWKTQLKRWLVLNGRKFIVCVCAHVLEMPLEVHVIHSISKLN